MKDVFLVGMLGAIIGFLWVIANHLITIETLLK